MCLVLDVADANAYQAQPRRIRFKGDVGAAWRPMATVICFAFLGVGPPRARHDHQPGYL